MNTKKNYIGYVFGLTNGAGEIVARGMNYPLVMNRQVRTPRFLANAPLAWLTWKATPEASAVHRPKVGA